METACVDGHSRLSVIGSYRPGPYPHKGKGVCVRDVCAIYDNNISPTLLMIIILSYISYKSDTLMISRQRVIIITFALTYDTRNCIYLGSIVLP